MCAGNRRTSNSPAAPRSSAGTRLRRDSIWWRSVALSALDVMFAERRFIRLLCFLRAAVVAADIHATAHFAHTAQSSVSIVKRKWPR